MAVTSLCLLAYLGDGHTHRFGGYKRTAGKAVTWLKRRVRPDGSLGGAHAAGLDQALGTNALCEAYAVSRDVTLKRYAEKAMGALLRLQNEDGGWGEAGAGSPSTTLLTGYGVLGLESGKTAGLPVPDLAFKKARGFLVRHTSLTGRVDSGAALLSSVEPGLREQRVPTATAVAVITRIFTGQRRTALRDSVRLFQLPDRFKPAPTYWYFGTYSMFQMGGDGWKSWNRAMQHALLSTQRHFGQPDYGSWNPTGIWGAWGGRTATTAINTLTLEIYYRYERAQAH